MSSRAPTDEGIRDGDGSNDDGGIGGDDERRELEFVAFADDDDGARWAGAFAATWPAYRRWYLSEGEAARPSLAECERALTTHVPELLPCWRRLVELAGGGELEARFLSLWRPPGIAVGCSQAVWHGPGGPLLVRNYDYHPDLFEATLLRTHWGARAVLGLSDCLVGLLDGVNEDGLAVALAFGGRRATGRGFGAPLVVRYLLETCRTTREALAVLRRVRTHVAYNFTVLDRRGDHATVFSRPEGPIVVRRVGIATNHQERVTWARHARASATRERERRLNELVADETLDREAFVARFLEPPLFARQWDRGIGTLYTAVYDPRTASLALHWPRDQWRQGLDAFEPGRRTVRLDVPHAAHADTAVAPGTPVGPAPPARRTARDAT